MIRLDTAAITVPVDEIPDLLIPPLSTPSSWSPS